MGPAAGGAQFANRRSCFRPKDIGDVDAAEKSTGSGDVDRGTFIAICRGLLKSHATFSEEDPASNDDLFAVNGADDPLAGEILEAIRPRGGKAVGRGAMQNRLAERVL